MSTAALRALRPGPGLFTGMGGVACGLGGGPALRRAGSAVAFAALAPPVLLSLAFPEGGWAPYPFTAYLPIPIFCCACLLALPSEERVLRAGAVLYGLGATAAAVVETPMGGTAARLGALFGGPLILCVTHRRLRGASRVLLAAALAGLISLGYWQWKSAIWDIDKALSDPAAQAEYFEPLRQFLATLPGGGAPWPDRDPAHLEPLGGIRGGAAGAPGARIRAPAGHRP